MRLDLIITMRDIYINFDPDYPQNAVAAAEVWNFKTSSHDVSLKQSQGPFPSAQE